MGVAGWGLGLKLGSESKGLTYTTHRSIGIAIFCLEWVALALAFVLRYYAYVDRECGGNPMRRSAKVGGEDGVGAGARATARAGRGGARGRGRGAGGGGRGGGVEAVAGAG